MSLDVSLTAIKPTEIFSWNITHNLGRMARVVNVSNKLTLYDVLWHPDSHGITTAGGLSVYLDKGMTELLRDPEHYKKYNSENGWGDYYGLVEFVTRYLKACLAEPNAEVSVSR